MNIFWVFIVASALVLVSCDNTPDDPELAGCQMPNITFTYFTGCGASIARYDLIENKLVKRDFIDNSNPVIPVVQKKLEKLDFIEKMIAAILAMSKKTEQRSDCIPFGGECNLIAGLNCCGFRNWCNYHDEYVPADKYNPARYINRCREGSLTAWAEDKWSELFG